MTGHQRKSAVPEKSAAVKEKPEGDGDSCRCKEVSKKTPVEMLKLMLSDLAFWRKPKGRKNE